MPKILIIEDDKKISIALAARIKAADYDVVFAHDAVRALTIAAQHLPDLVVADINMPGGDGFTVAERLHNLAQTADIPIIFMTASTQIGLRERAMALGAVELFEKPYDADELVATIALALSSPRSQGAEDNANQPGGDHSLSLIR